MLNIKKYTVFIIVIIVIMTIITIAILLKTHKDIVNNNQRILIKESYQINNFLTESFAYTNRINSHRGKQIAYNGADDLDFIYRLFLKENHIPKKDSKIFSWTSFDWVNDKGFQAVNSRIGIRKNPPNMNNIREYTQTSPKHAWTLQVSPPTIGNPSGVWVIPASTGITNNKGKYLGSVVVGFNINVLTNKIIDRIDNNNVNFVILDKKYNIIIQSSPDDDLKKHESFYKKIFNQYQPFDSKAGKGFLEEEVKMNGIIYYYYHKTDNSFYTILTGFEKSYINQQLNIVIFLKVSQLISITLLFIICIYLFRSDELFFKNEKEKKRKKKTVN